MMPHCKVLAFRLKTNALCQEKLDLGPKQLHFEIHLCLFFRAFQFVENEIEGKLFAQYGIRQGLTPGDRKQAMKLIQLQNQTKTSWLIQTVLKVENSCRSLKIVLFLQNQFLYFCMHHLFINISMAMQNPLYKWVILETI